MLGTPCLDGRPEAFFANSVIQTIKLAARHGIDVAPILMSYDALVQRARNDIVKLALENDFDDLLMIDDDEEWDPAHAIALLQHQVDVVGAAVRKKTDDAELYNVKAASLPLQGDATRKLWIVDAIGTGFLRLTRRALGALWNCSEEYLDDYGQHCRMVFNVGVIGGRLWGEDTFMCQKLTQAGFKIHVDPTITVAHIGMKKYSGDFAQYIRRLLNEDAKLKVVK